MVDKNEQAMGTGIRAPRPWWMEFILNFATFGLYSSFWMFARAQELRILTGRRLIPWLWFFVPLFAPAQLFAVPRFIKAWDGVGEPRGGDEWSNWTGPITLAMVLLTVAPYSYDVFPDLVPLETSLAALLLCWAGLISGMNARVNRFKRSIPEDKFRDERRGYTVLEWILLACLSPVLLMVFGALAIDGLAYDDLEELPADSDFVDPNGAFRFPVVGDGWRSIEIGKYSAGDAAVEIEGPADTMYFLVFEHGRSALIGDVVSMRMAENRDEFTDSACKEWRRFVGNQPIVLSYTECKGRLLLEPALQTVTVFEVDGKVYELYGRLNVTSLSINRLAVDFRKTARGFEPL